MWATWGYHADSTMLAIAALWPLLMLLALTLLGRNRSANGMLVLALALLPALALMAIGFKKRDLFEVRYFSGAVPMLSLLCARGVVTSSARRLPVLIATAALLATLALGTADEQLAKNNPRDYDFRTALKTLRGQIRPGDELLYAPNYLQDVIEYYTPGINAHALGPGRPTLPSQRDPAHPHVYLLASFLDQPGVPAAVGTAKYAIEHAGMKLVGTQTLEKIYVWEYG